MSEQYQEILTTATNLYNRNPDWATYHREVLGVEGIVRKTFTTPEAMSAFEQTQEFSEIHQMLAKLRERTAGNETEKEPTRVITVRLPKSLHESLKAEAHDHHTSINKLCISKLLQVVDEQLVPADA